MAQREYFCRVGEWYRTSARGVEGIEEVDEKRYGTQSVAAIARDEEAHSSSEEGPKHLRECENQEIPPAESVDCPDSWPSEDKVDDTKAEGSKECADIARTCFGEDGGGVEGDDVDWIILSQLSLVPSCNEGQ